MCNELEIILTYFKAIRSEADLRIKNHGYLTISKIIGCTALLAHLLDNDKSDISTLIIVPILAFSLDLIIYHNIWRVNEIGTYIKIELEKKVFKPILPETLVLYEQNRDKTQFMDIAFDRFGQFVITAIFSILIFVLTMKDYNYQSLPSSWQLWVVIILLLADGIAAYKSTVITVDV